MSGELAGLHGHIKQGENIGEICNCTIYLSILEKYGTVIGKGWADLENDDDILKKGAADAVFKDGDWINEEPIIIEKIEYTETERIITFKTDLDRKAPLVS